MTSKSSIDARVVKYVDHLFANVGPTPQLFDLKEELATNLKEKIADLMAQGLGPEEAFKEAVVSLGDVSGLVHEMRQLAKDLPLRSGQSRLLERVSIGGIILGVLLILFGILVMSMLYFMVEDPVAVTGNAIMVVVGIAVLTFSLLIRETKAKYGMHPVRAALYSLSLGVMLFGVFAAVVSRYSTGEIYISIASLIPFLLPGVGLGLLLLLTETDRKKP